MLNPLEFYLFALSCRIEAHARVAEREAYSKGYYLGALTWSLVMTEAILLRIKARILI